MIGGNVDKKNIDIENIKDGVLSYTKDILGLNNSSGVSLQDYEEFKQSAIEYGEEKLERAFLNEKNKKLSIHLDGDYLKRTGYPEEMATSIIAFFQAAAFFYENTEYGKKARENPKMENYSLLNGICKKVEIDTLEFLEIDIERIKNRILYGFNREGWEIYEKLEEKAKEQNFLNYLYPEAGIQPRIGILQKDMRNIEDAIERIHVCLGKPGQYRDIEKELKIIQHEADKVNDAPEESIRNLDSFIKEGPTIFLESDSLHEKNLDEKQKAHISVLQEFLDKLNNNWLNKHRKQERTIIKHNEKYVLKAALLFAGKSDNFDKTLRSLI